MPFHLAPRPSPLTALVALALLLGASPARAQLIPSYGETRAGTAGFQFLDVPVDPRGAATGGTAVATADDASSLFWNPALAPRTAAETGGTEIGAAHLNYHAGVQLVYGAAIRRVGPITLGAHVQSLSSGEMAVTDEFSGPAGTGETFSYNAVVGGLTVSQALTDLFSYGVTAKLAHEASAGVSASVPLLDLGVHYRIGNTGAALGVAIRNFGLNASLDGDLTRTDANGNPVIETDFDDIVPPTALLLGARYDVLRQAGGHALTVAGQLTNPNDNAERVTVGAEYGWNDLLFVRTGYQFGVEEATLPTFGFGVNVPGLGARQLRADYGFAQMDRLGATHRIGLNVRL